MCQLFGTSCVSALVSSLPWEQSSPTPERSRGVKLYCLLVSHLSGDQFHSGLSHRNFYQLDTNIKECSGMNWSGTFVFFLEQRPDRNISGLA